MFVPVNMTMRGIWYKVKTENGKHRKKSSKNKRILLGSLFLLIGLLGEVIAIIEKRQETFIPSFVALMIGIGILWLGRRQHAAETSKLTDKSKNQPVEYETFPTPVSNDTKSAFNDLFENSAFSGTDNQMEFFTLSQSGVPYVVVYELSKDNDLQVIRSTQVSFAKLRAAAKQVMDPAKVSFEQERLKLFAMLEEYNWESLLKLSQSLDDRSGNAKYWRNRRKGWSFHNSVKISPVTLSGYLDCSLRLDCTEDGCIATLVDHIQDVDDNTREISIRLPQSFPANFSADDLAKLLNCLPPAGPYREDSGPYRKIEAKELLPILRAVYRDYEGDKLSERQLSRSNVKLSSESGLDTRISKLQKLMKERHSDCIRTVMLKKIMYYSSENEPEELAVLELLEKIDGWYLECSVRYHDQPDVIMGRAKVEFDPAAPSIQMLQQIQKISAVGQEMFAPLPPHTPLDPDAIAKRLQNFFAPFRYRLAMQSKPYLHRLDSHASQDPNWEIERLGIDLNSGRPYLELGRQKSFGFVLGGEEELRLLNKEEYRKALKRFPDAPAWAKELNENNWKTLLEQPLKEFSGRCQERIAYFRRSTLRGPFPEVKGKPVQRVIITLHQRFGESAACFRKLKEGYRLFYVGTSDPNYPYLPSLTNQGLENRINDILEGSSSVDCFDRLLNQEETKAFLSELEESRPEDNEIWNDAYGSASMQISILYLDGTEENINKTSKYAMRLLNTAAELATVGLDHKKNVTEASKVTDKSINEVSEVIEKTSKEEQRCKQAGLQKIQRNILEFVNKNEGNSWNYPLGFLESHEAGSIIQKFDERQHWDGIGFNLDLRNRKITVMLCMYPDMSPKTRSCPPIKKTISVQDFLECIKLGGFSPEWSFIENEEDWDAVFEGSWYMDLKRMMNPEQLAQVGYQNSPSNILTLYRRKEFGSKQYSYWLTVEWWEKANYNDPIIPQGSYELPEKFLDMTAVELADWINESKSVEKTGRNGVAAGVVKPEEATALLDKAKRTLRIKG